MDAQLTSDNPVAKERNELKMSLRRKKERFASLEELIRKEAEQLEERESVSSFCFALESAAYVRTFAAMRKRREEAELAAKLSKECEAMETEIAMLKNKRSPTEVSFFYLCRVETLLRPK